MSNNQLTNMIEYDVNRMTFSEPSKSNNAFKYQRIHLGTVNPDGTKGDLIVESTANLFSYGIKENENPVTKVIDSFSLPIYLWNRNGPTDEEKMWTDKLNQIVEHCKHHLMEHKNDIGRWDLEMVDLRKMDPLYWKRDKTTGAIESGTGPSLYVKLISPKDQDGNFKFQSFIFDENTGDEINPLSIIQKRCMVNAAIKFESIYIGPDGKIRLQIKLWEANVSLMDVGRKRLLTSPALVRKPLPDADEAFDEYMNEGSISVSEDEREYVVSKSSERKKVSKRRTSNCVG